MVVALAILGIMSLVERYRSRHMVAVMSEGRAFEESLKVPPDPEQVSRLGPLVDRVVVIDVEAGHQRRYSGTSYHAFVVDVHGSSHDLLEHSNLSHTVSVAREFAAAFEVELEVPGHLA